MALARFCQTLSLLLNNQIYYVLAIKVAGNSSGSTHLEKIMEQCSLGVENGYTFSSVLAQYQNIPSILVQMVSVGEVSGNLPEISSRLGSYYEKEASSELEKFTQDLEPFIIIIIGSIVGFIMFSLYQPIFDLANQMDLNI